MAGGCSDDRLDGRGICASAPGRRSDHGALRSWAGDGNRTRNNAGDRAFRATAGGEKVMNDIRALLIEKVTATGGHLGASLGAVDLCIAVHRVFDSPRDVI